MYEPETIFKQTKVLTYMQKPYYCVLYISELLKLEVSNIKISAFSCRYNLYILQVNLPSVAGVRFVQVEVKIDKKVTEIFIVLNYK